MTLLCNRLAFKTPIVFSVCALVHLLSTRAPIYSQGSAAKVLTIADGTPVHLYLMDDITSKTNKVGDIVHFKVREGVEVGGIVVIPADSAVVGRVVAIGRSRIMGHSGALGLSIEYALASSGAKILLRGEAKVKGGSRGATTLESAAWFGPVAFIHKGTMLNAYVDGNQSVSLVPEQMPR